MTGRIIFEERQRFTQPWLWVILGCINLIFVIGFVKQVILGHPFGNRPLGNEGLILTGIFVMLLSAFFLYLRMDTQIGEDGICYRFFPFQQRMTKISWDEVEQVYVRKYEPLKEYGGWGLRFGLGNGRAVNVSGNEGIQIVMRNGNRVLLGTNKPEEAAEALKKIKLMRHGLATK